MNTIKSFKQFYTNSRSLKETIYPCTPIEMIYKIIQLNKNIRYRFLRKTCYAISFILCFINWITSQHLYLFFFSFSLLNLQQKHKKQIDKKKKVNKHIWWQSYHVENNDHFNSLFSIKNQFPLTLYSKINPFLLLLRVRFM